MIEVFKKMVEALECALSEDKPYIDECKQAIQAGKQAIAELESQEPVSGHIGWLVRNSQGKLDLLTELQIDSSLEKYERLHKLYTHPPQRTKQKPIAMLFGSLPVYDTSPTRTEQEPVGEFKQSPHGNYLQLVWKTGYVAQQGDKLYTTPPAQPAQRTWVGLTDERREQLIQKCWSEYIAGKEDGTTFGEWMSVATEAELKEKNT